MFVINKEKTIRERRQVKERFRRFRQPVNGRSVSAAKALYNRSAVCKPALLLIH